MKASQIKTSAGKQQQAVQSKAKNQAPEGSILQAYKKGTAQLQATPEEEPVQGKFETAQLEGEEDEEPAQLKENKTGLPDNLKSGVENLSGLSLDDVKVHYESSKPAELQAHAYAQGTDIHVAPGQEKHLPHEAWHVAQQKQGRVKPTMQLKGTVPVNDDAGLEKEADVMGAKAMNDQKALQLKKTAHSTTSSRTVFQRQTWSTGKIDNNQTDVTWTTSSLGGSTVGTNMVANPLGPEHLQGGPPQSGAQKSLMNLLETDPENTNENKYIRGHLLNDNLGGPGVDTNLFPITANANKQHEQKIESQVKNWVNDRKQWVKYEVNVSNITGDLSKKKIKDNYVNASFDCKASVLDPSQNMKEIHSISASILSEYKTSHDNDVKGNKQTFANPGLQAGLHNPLLSTSKKVTTGGYNEEIMGYLLHLFSDTKTAKDLKKALLKYEGIGKVTVDVLEGLTSEDESSMDKKEKMALNKIFSLGNNELLSILGDVYDEHF